MTTQAAIQFSILTAHLLFFVTVLVCRRKEITFGKAVAMSFTGAILMFLALINL